MNTLNRVTLMGTLGKDKKIEKGEYAQLSLATYDFWDDTHGDFTQNVDWHTVTIFNEEFLETIVPSLKKGDLVFVEGTLKTSQWTDALGNSHQISEVVVGRGMGSVLRLKPSLEVLDDEG